MQIAQLGNVKAAIAHAHPALDLHQTNVFIVLHLQFDIFWTIYAMIFVLISTLAILQANYA